MPLRPDLPLGGMSRRTTTPVKLPRMNFPMIGGPPAPEPASPTHEVTPVPFPEQVDTTIPAPAEAKPAQPVEVKTPAQEAAKPMAESKTVATKESGRVIVYGRSGCAACMAAIEDLMERNMSFQYVDVTRDKNALSYLQAICAGEPVVPVIIQIGFNGT